MVRSAVGGRDIQPDEEEEQLGGTGQETPWGRKVNGADTWCKIYLLWRPGTNHDAVFPLPALPAGRLQQPCVRLRLQQAAGKHLHRTNRRGAGGNVTAAIAIHQIIAETRIIIRGVTIKGSQDHTRHCADSQLMTLK